MKLIQGTGQVNEISDNYLVLSPRTSYSGFTTFFLKGTYRYFYEAEAIVTPGDKILRVATIESYDAKRVALDKKFRPAPRQDVLEAFKKGLERGAEIAKQLP